MKILENDEIEKTPLGQIQNSISLIQKWKSSLAKMEKSLKWNVHLYMKVMFLSILKLPHKNKLKLFWEIVKSHEYVWIYLCEID